jgi:hypothetical protein
VFPSWPLFLSHSFRWFRLSLFPQKIQIGKHH